MSVYLIPIGIVAFIGFLHIIQLMLPKSDYDELEREQISGRESWDKRTTELSDEYYKNLTNKEYIKNVTNHRT